MPVVLMFGFSYREQLMEFRCNPSNKLYKNTLNNKIPTEKSIIFSKRLLHATRFKCGHESVTGRKLNQLHAGD